MPQCPQSLNLPRCGPHLSSWHRINLPWAGAFVMGVSVVLVDWELAIWWIHHQPIQIMGLANHHAQEEIKKVCFSFYPRFAYVCWIRGGFQFLYLEALSQVFLEFSDIYVISLAYMGGIEYWSPLCFSVFFGWPVACCLLTFETVENPPGRGRTIYGGARNGQFNAWEDLRRCI